jgi:hypothetical protein
MKVDEIMRHVKCMIEIRIANRSLVRETEGRKMTWGSRYT